MFATILLVEDEPAIADTIAYALRSQGYEVARSATGRGALERLRADRVDCMVLDIGLPDRNGFELCKEVRAWSSVPIIFVTARAEEVDRVVGLEIGGDDYVVKPFSPRELAARVGAVLRRSSVAALPSTSAPAAAAHTPATLATPPIAASVDAGASPSARASSGVAGAGPTPFVVDRNRMEISCFGTPLVLSRCEFRILDVLVARPGWVFSRGRLLELAWDQPDASLERTVDSHIKAIRAKLRRVTPDCDPIRTHRGLGYSLRESW